MFTFEMWVSGSGWLPSVRQVTRATTSNGRWWTLSSLPPMRRRTLLPTPAAVARCTLSASGTQATTASRMSFSSTAASMKVPSPGPPEKGSSPRGISISGRLPGCRMRAIACSVVMRWFLNSKRRSHHNRRSSFAFSHGRADSSSATITMLRPSSRMPDSTCELNSDTARMPGSCSISRPRSISVPNGPCEVLSK